MQMNVIQAFDGWRQPQTWMNCGKGATYPREINNSYTFRPQALVRNVCVQAGGERSGMPEQLGATWC